MGRRLPIEIVNQIKLRLDHNERISHIATALKVSRDTIYKVQLNFDLWDQPYAPPSVKLGRPSTLLEYQKLVCFKVRAVEHPTSTIDGYMGRIIYQGAINAELFEDFVEHHVLPNTTPYPRPRSIIHELLLLSLLFLALSSNRCVRQRKYPQVSTSSRTLRAFRRYPRISTVLFTRF
jgi:hypothetical protein